MPSSLRPRHSRRCPKAKDREAKCRCKPAWRASVRTKDGFVEKSFPTRAAAKAWRIDADKLAKDRKLRPPTRQTFAEVAEEWLASAKAEPPTVLARGGRRYKPSALRGIEADLRNYWLDDFGGHRLSDIDRRDVQKLVNRLISEGKSSSRVRNIVNAGRVVFRNPVEDDELQANPCANLRLPATDDPVDRAHEPTVALAWLDAALERDRAMWGCAFFAGIRRGELQALKWTDVTLNDGTGPLAGWITVSRGWDRVAGEIAPKSRRAKRRVPIVRPYLADLLVEHKRLTGRDGDDYVFGTTADRPFEDYDGRTAKALKAANVERVKAGLDPLPKITLHPGRHTYGAMLRAAGVRESDINDFIGHSRPGGVTVRYTSALDVDGRDADAMALFATYLNRVDSADRIEQLETAETADAADLARELVKRYGQDVLAKVAELLAVKAA